MCNRNQDNVTCEVCSNWHTSHIESNWIDLQGAKTLEANAALAPIILRRSYYLLIEGKGDVAETIKAF